MEDFLAFINQDLFLKTVDLEAQDQSMIVEVLKLLTSVSKKGRPKTPSQLDEVLLEIMGKDQGSLAQFVSYIELRKPGSSSTIMANFNKLLENPGPEVLAAWFTEASELQVQKLLNLLKDGRLEEARKLVNGRP